MNTLSIIIGNVCSLLAMVTDSISSTRKTAKGVLWVQNLSQLIYCTGSFILGGYSACAQNLVSILRNLVAIRGINSKAIEWFMVVLGVALGIGFNNLGLVGYLPVIANLQYTLIVFKFKDNERALKMSFVVCCVLFAIFNLFILNFVGVVTNLFVIVTTIIVLAKGK